MMRMGAYKLDPTNGVMLDVNYDRVHHYLFVKYNKKSDKCVIFGTGAINKKKVDLPYFDRLKWYDKIPCNVIYYFDSTLLLNDTVNLGWLYGTNQRWYLKEIEELIRLLLKKMNVDSSNTIFAGSSGGGFTSCALATLFNSKAIVYNPQLICKNWSIPHIEALKTVLKEEEELDDNRLNLNNIITHEGSCPLLHICQNVYAEEDIINQIVPFVKQLPEEYLLCERVRFDFYSNEKGHNGMVDNDKTIDMILTDLEKE